MESYWNDEIANGLGGICGFEASSADWTRLNGVTLLLRKGYTRVCPVPPSRENVHGNLYLSFSESADIVTGDLLVGLGAQQAWRITDVRHEMIGGIVMQKQVFYRETSMGDFSFGLSNIENR